jgi:HAD superfamily hydrolase (TIGR01509 family)
MPVRALIFDVDGTLAETEEIHRAAFNAAFTETGIGWFWTVDMYARLLKVTGGRERIAAYGDEIGSLPGDIPALHRRKTDIYNERIRSGGIALRPGVERLIRTAREHKLTLAIATTTSRPNVISLIMATLGESAVAWFASIRTGEDVSRKKPDPEVFNLVLADLGQAAADCVAFEDSANGLKAALAAGIPTIVTPGIYTQDEDFAAAAFVLKNLDEPGEAWMRRLNCRAINWNRDCTPYVVPDAAKR